MKYAMTTTIDAAGRIVIPKAIRETAGLYAGAAVQIELSEDGVMLSPAPGAMRLERRGRFLVAVADEATGTVTDNEVAAVQEQLRSREVPIQPIVDSK